MATKKIRSIRAMLPKRNESIQDLSEKTVRFLRALKDVDNNLFLEWYEQGWSKVEAKEKVVLFTVPFISQIIEKQWDNKFQQLGTSFTFWTGSDDETKNAKISFRLGMTSDKKLVNNFIGITLPFDEQLQFDADDPRIKTITALMIEVFNANEVNAD